MLSLTVSKACTVIVGFGLVEPFHPLNANPLRVIVSVIARALGIFGTIVPSKGPGMTLSARNMERATARYPSFAMAVYYTYRNLIIPSALFQKQGPVRASPSRFPEGTRRACRAFRRNQTSVRVLLTLGLYLGVLREDF